MGRPSKIHQGVHIQGDENSIRVTNINIPHDVLYDDRLPGAVVSDVASTVNL